ncbi:MAG: membrane protein insertion efficiency factor YidD [Oscillospiraceae bacterium]|nr:membrane protein insertion efficiency factor YidD [Oscillospiraceae bacterium]
MKYILIAFIKLYRITLSKIIPPSCRFTPSCSVYAISALERFGAVKGGYLSFKRIVRCNPFSPGGEDKVPATFAWRRKKEGESS